jgi:hypothetical protein
VRINHDAVVVAVCVPPHKRKKWWKHEPRGRQSLWAPRVPKKRPRSMSSVR